MSDPTSPTYGEFLTRQQVAAMTDKKTEDMDAVTCWLTANGVQPTIRNSNFVATMSVAQAPRRPQARWLWSYRRHRRVEAPRIVGAPLRASSGIEVSVSSAARRQQHSSLAGDEFQFTAESKSPKSLGRRCVQAAG